MLLGRGHEPHARFRVQGVRAPMLGCMKSGVPSFGEIREAAILGCAIFGHSGDSAATRVLVIKGLVADAHYLRQPRVPADVDVLVASEDVAAVHAALAGVGWRPRPTSDLGDAIVDHSVTLCHAGWPCDIDVHRHYPGMLARPERAFEALWRDRVTLSFAGVPVRAAGLLSSVLIQALHALHTPAQSPRHAAELEALTSEVVPRLSMDERRALVELARDVGALDTARPLLEHLGLPLPSATAEGVDPRLDAWRLRTGADGLVPMQVAMAVAREPWRSRPRALWRALWPSAKDMRIDHPELGPGSRAVVMARIARIGRGVRAAPKLVASIRARRRRAREARRANSAAKRSGGLA